MKLINTEVRGRLPLHPPPVAAAPPLHLSLQRHGDHQPPHGPFDHKFLPTNLKEFTNDHEEFFDVAEFIFIIVYYQETIYYTTMSDYKGRVWGTLGVVFLRKCSFCHF